MSGDPFGLIGHVIDSHLRVDQAIGEGGASVVYKGHHLGLDEPVAIKCLRTSTAPDAAAVESFVRRFRDESRICYRLSRGNLDIVRSITSGTTTTAHGTLVPYMALEWLEGRSLADDLKERRTKKLSGRGIEDVLAMFEPAAQAIAYAHSQGVVHRDIKPGNLFLCATKPNEAARMKVLDFGLAKILHDEVLGMVPYQTGGGMFLFSPSYGAPEQFDPKVGKIGPWTDVYALAVVLMEALRDKKVRSSDSVANQVIRALDPENRPTPRALGLAVGEGMEAVMARAVALRPEGRPQDAGAFWKELHEALHKDAAALSKTAESGVPAEIAAQMVSPKKTVTDDPLHATYVTGPPLMATTVRMHEPPRMPPARSATQEHTGEAGEATEGGTGTLVMARPQIPPRVPIASSAPPPALAALTSTASLPPPPSRLAGSVPAPAPAPSTPALTPSVPAAPPSKPAARNASERPKNPELSKAVGPWLSPDTRPSFRVRAQREREADKIETAKIVKKRVASIVVIVLAVVAIAIFVAYRLRFVERFF